MVPALLDCRLGCQNKYLAFPKVSRTISPLLTCLLRDFQFPTASMAFSLEAACERLQLLLTQRKSTSRIRLDVLLTRDWIETAVQGDMVALCAITIFELFRSSTYFKEVLGMNAHRIRNSLDLWTHRKLFSEVDKLFAAAEGDNSAPAGLHTFARLYEAAVHRRLNFIQATSCNYTCSTIAIRYI